MNQPVPQLDPHRTTVVVKFEGKEIGRTAATNPRLIDYITTVANGRSVTVDYEKDEFGLMNLLNRPR